MIKDRIRQILVGCGVAVDASDDDDRPFAEYGVDSLKTVEVMLAIERELDLVFPEEYLTTSTFRSLSSVAAAVTNLVQPEEGVADGR